jgi:hypothetical protein
MQRVRMNTCEWLGEGAEEAFPAPSWIVPSRDASRADRSGERTAEFFWRIERGQGAHI